MKSAIGVGNQPTVRHRRDADEQRGRGKKNTRPAFRSSSEGGCARGGSSRGVGAQLSNTGVTTTSVDSPPVDAPRSATDFPAAEEFIPVKGGARGFAQTVLLPTRSPPLRAPIDPSPQAVAKISENPNPKTKKISTESTSECETAQIANNCIMDGCRTELNGVDILMRWASPFPAPSKRYKEKH